VAPNFGDADSIAISNGHLLEDQAVYTNLGLWMNYDSVGMGNQQPPADVAGQGNVSTCHDAPEAMA
jgi:hypothetical protein